MSNSVVRGRQFEEVIKMLLRNAGYITRIGKNSYCVLLNVIVSEVTLPLGVNRRTENYN